MREMKDIKLYEKMATIYEEFVLAGKVDDLKALIYRHVVNAHLKGLEIHKYTKEMANIEEYKDKMRQTMSGLRRSNTLAEAATNDYYITHSTVDYLNQQEFENFACEAFILLNTYKEQPPVLEESHVEDIKAKECFYQGELSGKVEAWREIIIEELLRKGKLLSEVTELVKKQTDVGILKKWSKLGREAISVEEFVDKVKELH